MAPPTPPLPSTKLNLAGVDEGVYTLCPFPSSSTSPVVAMYGGDDGTVYLLPTPSGNDSTTPTSSTDQQANNGNKGEPKSVRTFDDPIRSIAVSSDGRRVAAGFEDGSTKIFAYDNYAFDRSDEEGQQRLLHPFLSASSSSASSSPGAGEDGMGGEGDDDDGFGDMMSQDPATTSPTKTSTGNAAAAAHTASYAGPRFEAPVRMLSFLPTSSSGSGSGSSNKYYLAIGTESSSSFCVIDATSAATASDLEGRYLMSEAETAHDCGGVRGLAIGNGTVATLGLDGRLCTWQTPIDGADTDPSINWDELHQDQHKAVPKADIGELNGSDVADRATRPAFGGGAASWLAIPGRSDVQLRHVADEFKKEHFLCSTVAEGGDDNGGGDGGVRGHSDVIVCLTFSPDGKFLASAGQDGRIVVWKVAQDYDANADDATTPPGEFVCELPRESIATFSKESAAAVVTSMLWTDDDALRIAGSDGSISVIANIDAFILGSASSAAKKTAESKALELTDTKKAEAPADKGYDSEGTVDHSESPQLETQPPEDASNKPRVSKKNKNANESDSDDDVDFSGGAETQEDGEKVEKPKSNRFVDEEADEDDDVGKDNDANIAKEQDEGPPADEIAAGSGDNFDDNDIPAGDDGEFPLADDDHDADIQQYSGRRATMDVPEMQPAFAPSSTPLSASTTRILCWNHIGTLTIRDDGSNNTVDINFVDGAFRRPVTFTDNLNFIVGSLGEDGGVFASDVADDDFDDGDDMNNLVDGLNMSDATKRILKRSNRRKAKGGADDSPKGSSVYFHRFETFGPIKDKDWVLTLPDGELVLGCACGEGWAAVATNRRFLRLYSSGGNQGPVTWLKGDLVTMVGRGRFLGVFYHECTPMPDGTQRLGYQLLDATNGSLISIGSVSAISPGSTMTWAGFSNDYSLMVMDSDGMLSMLASENGANGTGGGGWEWSPMLDTVGLRKSNDDSFWPVTCMDGKLVCVPLKGGNEHPDAVRRPVTTALGFRMPLARGALAKFNALEDLQVRADLSLKQKKFVNDSIAPDDEELMAEYDAMCAQVDKVTLKLFFDILKAGKVERALDLVERLHLEKSFEIAIKASDRLNYLKLSDRIEAARDSRFPMEPMQEFDDGVDKRYFAQRPYTDDYRDERGGGEDESIQSSTAITPDVNRRGGVKRGREEFHSDIDEEEEEVIEERRPATKKKSFNPFAKKKVESPAKLGKENGGLASPLRSPSAKPTLSRNSTFSAQSRAKTKGQKRIL